MTGRDDATSDTDPAESLAGAAENTMIKAEERKLLDSAVCSVSVSYQHHLLKPVVLHLLAPLSVPSFLVNLRMFILFHVVGSLLL